MRFIYKIISNNIAFSGALASSLAIIVSLAPYHQSVSQAVDSHTAETYSVTMDIDANQLDSMLQRRQLCIYNSKSIHIYNFLSPASSLGYECTSVTRLDKIAEVASGVRVRITSAAKNSFAKTPFIKAKVILGEVPLAYEVWRRLVGYRASTHKDFEKPLLPQKITSSSVKP